VPLSQRTTWARRKTTNQQSRAGDGADKGLGKGGHQHQGQGASHHHSVAASAVRGRWREIWVSTQFGRIMHALAVLLLAALCTASEAFLQLPDAGCALRHGLRGGGVCMSAFPTIDLNDGTKHPMV
jgi:hypothetical protein